MRNRASEEEQNGEREKRGGQRVGGLGEGKEERERRERPLATILLLYFIF
jgi:hypothetical protein